MVSSGILVSTVVMGVLLVGAAVAVARMRQWREYTPQLRATGSGVAALPGDTRDSGGVSGNAAAFVAAVLVAVVAGAAVVFDAGTVALAGVAVALVAAYFSWGVYAMARARGLPFAHSVGLSAWLFGFLLVGGIALELLVG
jgi:amino acid transporter